MLACDFKKVLETTPVKPIVELMHLTKAKLYVLHVNHDHESYSPEMHNEIQILDSLFMGLYPEFNFVDDEDFMNGINDFAVENNIDIVITIPKKHNFFEKLFKRSHLKKLVFHSHTPLMVVHD